MYLFFQHIYYTFDATCFIVHHSKIILCINDIIFFCKSISTLLLSELLLDILFTKNTNVSIENLTELISFKYKYITV
jgi:hypothetical protein